EVGDPTNLTAKIVPGGALLAVVPQRHPLWDLSLQDCSVQQPDFPAEFADNGAVPLSLGSWPCAVVWARRAVETAKPVSSSLLLGLLVEGRADGLAEALVSEGHNLVSPQAAGDGILFVVANEAEPLAQVSRLLPQFARLAATAEAQQ